MPDGTSQDLTLTATTSRRRRAQRIQIGASSAVTAANLQAALTPALGTLAATSLSAASAVGGRQRLLQHRRRQSAAAGRRPAVRHRDRAGRRHRRQHRDLVHSAKPAPTIRARPRWRASTSRWRCPMGCAPTRKACAWRSQSIAVFAATTSRPAIPTRKPATPRSSSASPRARRAAGRAEDHRHRGRHRRGAHALEPPRIATSRPRTRWSNCCRTSKARRPKRSRRKILALQTNLQATLQTTAMLLRTNLLEYL